MSTNSSETKSQKITENLDALNKNVLEIFNKLSKAGKWVGFSFIVCGFVLIIILIIAKLTIFDCRILTLQSNEFIAVTIMSSIFIIVGALLRFFVYKNNYELTKLQHKFGSSIIKDSLEKGFELDDK